MSNQVTLFHFPNHFVSLSISMYMFYKFHPHKLKFHLLDHTVVIVRDQKPFLFKRIQFPLEKFSFGKQQHFLFKKSIFLVNYTVWSLVSKWFRKKILSLFPNKLKANLPSQHPQLGSCLQCTESNDVAKCTTSSSTIIQYKYSSATKISPSFNSTEGELRFL